MFVIESFIDELAAAAKQDPVEYRRALLRKSPRAQRVLDVATKAAGWGKPLPEGWGRGVSVRSHVLGHLGIEVSAGGSAKIGEWDDKSF